MAPPSYSDLGKKASDIHSKGFYAGILKFETKTKSESGTKFTTNGQMNMESGKAVGATELAFNWPDYGLKYVEKWNTDNQLVVDMSIEDKVLQGLKTSFISSFNPTTNRKMGTLKNNYKHEYVNVNADVDLDYAGPTFKGSMVCGYKGWLAGYQMALNTSKGKLSANNLSVSYDAGDQVVHAAVNNGQDVAASYYHRLNNQFEGGLLVGWSAATRTPQVSVAGKYSASSDTCMKVKASMNGELGCSLQQKVSDCLSLTLSSVLDAKNISAGGHRVGLSVEFEQ